MFDKKNDYALNKADRNAIVYQDAFGTLIRITPEQLPSIKEFRKWKNWSTMKAHTTEKKEHIHRNHTISMTDLEVILLGEDGIDISYEAKETIHENQVEAIKMVQRIKTILTEKQFRRLWLYTVEGMTLAEIAKSECATIASVQESIVRAKNRCRKFFKTP